MKMNDLGVPKSFFLRAVNKCRSGVAAQRTLVVLLGAVLLACFIGIIPVATRGWKTLPRPSGDVPQSPPVQAGTPQSAIGAGAVPGRSPATDDIGHEERLPAWEMQIEELLSRPIPPEEAGRLLLNLLPSLPKEGQVEAADHLANLLSDEDFPKVRPLLLNPNTPIEVQDALFFELINRDDSVRMPLLLAIARQRGHPYEHDARDSLEMIVGEDLGEDWDAWQAAVEQRLEELK